VDHDVPSTEVATAAALDVLELGKVIIEEPPPTSAREGRYSNGTYVIATPVHRPIDGELQAILADRLVYHQFVITYQLESLGTTDVPSDLSKIE